MRILVTGATGYIGTVLCAQALAAEHVLFAASRAEPSFPGPTWVPYRLEDEALAGWPAQLDAVIHLAADVRPDADEATELAAAQRLIAYAQRNGTKFIFVSSQAASPEAPTAYGRSKAAIEARVLAAGGAVLRPGLVYGGAEQGLWGTLCAVVKTFPILPRFVPEPMVQPVHVEDVAAALLQLATQPHESRIYRLGAVQPIAFSNFLRNIAAQHFGLLRRWAPVPQRVVYQLSPWVVACKRLCSLFALPVMDTAADWAALNIVPRTLDEGLQQPPLLREAEAMLRYVGVKDMRVLAPRYVAALQALGDAVPLALPAWVLNYPALLALWDGAENSDFQARLNVATRLFEATPLGAQQMLGAGSSPIAIILRLSVIALAEILWRVVSFVYQPRLP